MYRIMYDQAADRVELAAAEKPVRSDLPDGSQVVLNSGAEVQYVLKKDLREVHMKGEAYIKVKHNKSVPFIIHVEDVLIEDIGTAFNVKALPGTNVVEVTVEEGEVRLYAAGQKGIRLVQGERGHYDKVTRTFTKLEAEVNKNAASYASRVFHFEEATLKEIISQINAVYETEISLSDEKMGDCKVSVTFNNERPEVIVDVLAETLDLSVERSGNSIILKGSPCEVK
jgi:ferric-dicitrate binding protein FerR (iron transport regulator)